MISAWRVFPWNPRVADGEPFTAAFVPGGQAYGRFDLPGEDAGVRYYAESPEHAIAEKIVRLRNQSIDDADLLEFGFRLALVEVRIDVPTRTPVFDLCSAESLRSLRIEPDETAFRDRRSTQGISQRIYDAGYVGLRWWSVFRGEWHTFALYTERVPSDRLRFEDPDPLTLDHPALRETADELGIAI